MKKYVPIEKLSKAKKREYYAAQRKNWGEINPVTRLPENPKAYKRPKNRCWKDDSGSGF